MPPKNLTRKSKERQKQEGQKRLEAISTLPSMQEVTYGIELEAYTLSLKKEEKTAFIHDLSTCYMKEQIQRVSRHLRAKLSPQKSNDYTTSALCCIKDAQGKRIMEVRLDGERDIAIHKDEAKDSCYNIEFVSVDSGIKKHKEFFEDIAKGKDSEMSQAINGFKKAVTLRTENARSTGTVSVLVNGYTYDFTPLGLKYLRYKKRISRTPL